MFLRVWSLAPHLLLVWPVHPPTSASGERIGVDMWSGSDKAWGCIEGALSGVKFPSILCFVLEIVCHGWRQPGESLGWETGTLLSSNWLLNNLTTQLAGPGRGLEQKCSGRRLRLPGLRYLPAALAPTCAVLCAAPLDEPLKSRWNGGWRPRWAATTAAGKLAIQKQ